MTDILDDLLKDPEADPAELASFEHAPPTKPMKPIMWSIEKYQVAQLLALSRLTVKGVSEATGVPVPTINRWKSHPEFQDYMTKITLEKAEALKAKRLQILMKILDARIERAEEMGDYAILSGKDTLEILAEMRKESEKGDGGEQSNYMKTIEALLLKSSEKKQLT